MPADDPDDAPTKALLPAGKSTRFVLDDEEKDARTAVPYEDARRFAEGARTVGRLQRGRAAKIETSGCRRVCHACHARAEIGDGSRVK